MSLDQALEISVSGIEAERRAMELISSNIANISTTRTIYGGPYRRKIAVFQEKPLTFEQVLSAAEARVNNAAGGVEVADVVDDMSPFQKVYKPGHPDADEQGFVQMPNVNLSDEMVDMIYVSKLYEANINAYNATKKMVTDTLTIQ